MKGRVCGRQKMGTHCRQTICRWMPSVGREGSCSPRVIHYDKFHWLIDNNCQVGKSGDLMHKSTSPHAQSLAKEPYQQWGAESSKPKILFKSVSQVTVQPATRLPTIRQFNGVLNGGLPLLLLTHQQITLTQLPILHTSDHRLTANPRAGS